jgi:hypothetical protein
MSPEFKVFFGVFLLAGAIVVALELREQLNPCLEFGAPETSYMLQSCGKDCTYMVPITSRPCLRRQSDQAKDTP